MEKHKKYIKSFDKLSIKNIITTYIRICKESCTSVLIIGIIGSSTSFCFTYITKLNMSGTLFYFFWGNGAHGNDLQTKGIVAWDIRNMSIWDKLPMDIRRCGVAVPIWTTCELIASLLRWDRTTEIVNFAWLMQPTTPDGSQISNLHALWWPSGTKNLRMVFATDWMETPLSRWIIQNAQTLWVNVIFFSRAEHDKQMALHQALTHIVIVLHDIHPSTNEDKISPPTSPQTIADMILYNPFFLEVWNQFCGYINSGKWLGEAYKLCMKEAHPNLSTPNSARQLDASTMWKFSPDTGTMNQLSAWLLEVTNADLIRIITASRDS